MSDENPYQPPATPIPRLPRPTAEHAEPIPFHKAILDHWALLFRSRARHLLQIYTNSIRAVDPTTTGTMTLDQARTRWEQLRTGPALSEAERDTFESQMVLAARMGAAWCVSWMSVLPGAVVVLLLVNWWRELRPPFQTSNLLKPVVMLALFPLFFIVSVSLQVIFLKPSNAWVSRLTGLPLAPPEPPKWDEPRDST